MRKAIIGAALTVLCAAGSARGGEAWVETRLERLGCAIEVPASWAATGESKRHIEWTAAGGAVCAWLMLHDEPGTPEELLARYREDYGGVRILVVNQADRVNGCPSVIVKGEVPRAGATPTPIVTAYVREPHVTFEIAVCDKRGRLEKGLVDRLLASFTSDPARRGRPGDEGFARVASARLGIAFEAPAAWGALEHGETISLRGERPIEGLLWTRTPGERSIDEVEARARALLERFAAGRAVVEPLARVEVGGRPAVRTVTDTIVGLRVAEVWVAAPGGVWKLEYSDEVDLYRADVVERALASAAFGAHAEAP